MGIANATIWKIQKEAKHSYVFGSMHIADQRAFSKVEQITDLLEECQTLFTEIDIESYNKIDPSLFHLPHQKTTEDFLTKNAMQRLNNAFEKYFNTSFVAYNRILPILTINKLSEHLLNSENEMPLDAQLYKLAKNKNLQTGGIETLADQMNVLKLIPLEYQFQRLKEVGRKPTHFKSQIEQLMSWYQAEDITEIYKAARRSLGKIRKLMLFDRNKRMASFINDKSDQSNFYVVGAAHLAGNEGVLALLKRSDFKLIPIK